MPVGTVACFSVSRNKSRSQSITVTVGFSPSSVLSMIRSITFGHTYGHKNSLR